MGMPMPGGPCACCINVVSMMGIHSYDHAPVGAHRTHVCAGAQDVHVWGAHEHVVAVGGCSGVLACRICVRLHRQEA
jgi:hypothetical protein